MPPRTSPWRIDTDDGDHHVIQATGRGNAWMQARDQWQDHVTKVDPEPEPQPRQEPQKPASRYVAE